VPSGSTKYSVFIVATDEGPLPEDSEIFEKSISLKPSCEYKRNFIKSFIDIL
jgi:hypothetical protein